MPYRGRLRSGKTKELVESLRRRVSSSYAVNEISRSRMKILMEDLDRFERHAFMPKSMLTHEWYVEKLGYKPVSVIRLSEVQRQRRSEAELEERWVRQSFSAPLTTSAAAVYGWGRQVFKRREEVNTDGVANPECQEHTED